NRLPPSKDGERYNPDFAAMARSAGVEGVRIDRAADLAEAVRSGVDAHKPYLIDVDIAADINPAGAGVWVLPGLGQSKPSIGTWYQLTWLLVWCGVDRPDVDRQEAAGWHALCNSFVIGRHSAISYGGHTSLPDAPARPAIACSPLPRTRHIELLPI